MRSKECMSYCHAHAPFTCWRYARDAKDADEMLMPRECREARSAMEVQPRVRALRGSHAAMSLCAAWCREARDAA